MPSDIHSPGRRLENIESIQPYIEALKTISLSKWKTSLMKKSRLEKYGVELSASLRQLGTLDGEPNEPAVQNRLTVMLGTNQGFCGNLNKKIYEFYVCQVLDESAEPENLVIIGDKLKKIFHDKGLRFSSFPEIGNDAAAQVHTIEEFIRKTISPRGPRLQTLSYSYQGAGQGTLALRTIAPLSFSFGQRDEAPQRYIIDSDLHELGSYLVHRLEAVSFYKVYLDAFAYENSIRYQTMENATTNADRLVEELQAEVQASRRQKITSEIRELAISAGLLRENK